jgi:hypothetical protein
MAISIIVASIRKIRFTKVRFLGFGKGNSCLAEDGFGRLGKIRILVRLSRMNECGRVC